MSGGRACRREAAGEPTQGDGVTGPAPPKREKKARSITSRTDVFITSHFAILINDFDGLGIESGR